MANEREELLIRDRVTQQPRPYYVHADNINLGDENNYQGLPAKLQQMTQAFTPDSAFDESSTRPIQNGVVKAAIDAINRAIDQLVGSDDVTTYIDSFNEVITFLAGVTNNETLTAKLYELQQAINSKQATLTFDDAPTQSSDNMVKSGGIYSALALKANSTDVYTKSQTYSKIEVDGLLQDVDVDLTDYYDKNEVDDAISQMEATIEQQQLTVITGGKLSLWLDDDGESINIMAGDVPDIAATPVISSELVSNDPSSADNGKVRVTIATTEQGATIYYTTDGSTPTQSSSQYSSAIVLDTAGQHTINAIAIVADKLPSSVATATVAVAACSTPTITVNNTDRVNAVVTAEAGNDESVSLTVGSHTDTGTGSASVTIAKTSSPQPLSASASATAAGKLPASATQSVEVSAKEAYSFGAHTIGGKAASANDPITLVVKNGVAAGDFVTVPVSFDEEDGEVFWHADLEGKLFSNTLQGKTENNSSISIFSEGATNVLSIEHIPIEVTVIMANAFQGATACTLFKATATGQSLTTLNGAIKKLTSVVNVYLPPTVTSVNNDFNGLTTLQSVSAPGVTTVDGAFGSCTGLTSVVLGQLTLIKSNAFFGCENLVFTGVDFTAVTSIASGGLQKCKKLGTITLNAINSIGSNAFAYFSSTALEIIITKPISSASDVPSLNSGAFTSTTNYVVKVPSNYLSFYQAASVWSDLYNNGKLEAITE